FHYAPRPRPRATPERPQRRILRQFLASGRRGGDCPRRAGTVPGVRAGAGFRGGWLSCAAMVTRYEPAPDRYEQMTYRRCGRSGLDLPAVSLGLWHNFGHDRPLDTSAAIVRRAFDLGVTHFDLANNYGPPYGSAEENFGRLLARDLRPFRDHGSRKYLLASLDQSLGRLGLEYVDIFYSHRFDPATPLEETMGALASA